MKSRLLTIVLLLVLTASLFGPLGGVTVAQAQTTCTDATGATVPCPPTGGDSSSDDTDDSGGNGGGSPNPPSVVTDTPSATPTPLPTHTPLPVSDKPTENPTSNAPVDVSPTPQELLPLALPTDRMIATCSSSDGKPCWEQAYLQCPNDIVVLETDPTNSTFGFFCIPDNDKPAAGLPLKAEPDSTERGWEGDCLGMDKIAQRCIDGQIQICLSVGGQPSTDVFDYNKNGGDLTYTNVGCNDVPSPGDDAWGQDTSPSIPWGPIGLVAIGIVILIGLLLPAVQKFTNNPKDPDAQTREHVLLANTDDKSKGTHKPIVITKELDKSTTGRDDVINREDKDKG